MFEQFSPGFRPNVKISNNVPYKSCSESFLGEKFLKVLLNVLIPMGGCVHVCVFVYVSFVFAEGFCDEFNFRWHRSSKTPFFARSSDQVLCFIHKMLLLIQQTFFSVLRMLKKTNKSNVLF